MEKGHRFVVLSHILTSYIATLAHYLKMKTTAYETKDFIKAAEDMQQYLTHAIACRNNDDPTPETIINKEALRQLNDKVNKLLQKRKEEIQ